MLQPSGLNTEIHAARSTVQAGTATITRRLSNKLRGQGACEKGMGSAWRDKWFVLEFHCGRWKVKRAASVEWEWEAGFAGHQSDLGVCPTSAHERIAPCHRQRTLPRQPGWQITCRGAGGSASARHAACAYKTETQSEYAARVHWHRTRRPRAASMRLVYATTP